jgi:hypothetical protein
LSAIILTVEGECWKPAVGKLYQGTNNSFRLKSFRCLENFMSIWCIRKMENTETSVIGYLDKYKKNYVLLTLKGE